MRIESNKNHNINFGWNYKMHSAVVKRLAQTTDIAPAILSKIAAGTQKPDFYENFILGQNHCYFPDTKLKSYMDFSGKHNARYMFFKHLDKMKKAILKGKNKKSYDEAGKALHYLQDITQPHHIKAGKLIQKIKLLIPHHAFELAVFKKQKNFYNSFTPVKIKADNFEELFDNTVELSLRNIVPVKKNYKKWDEIGQKAVNLLESATIKFLEMVKDILN